MSRRPVNALDELLARIGDERDDAALDVAEALHGAALDRALRHADQDPAAVEASANGVIAGSVATLRGARGQSAPQRRRWAQWLATAAVVTFAGVLGVTWYPGPGEAPVRSDDALRDGDANEQLSSAPARTLAPESTAEAADEDRPRIMAPLAEQPAPASAIRALAAEHKRHAPTAPQMAREASAPAATAAAPRGNAVEAPLERRREVSAQVEAEPQGVMADAAPRQQGPATVPAQRSGFAKARDTARKARLAGTVARADDVAARHLEFTLGPDLPRALRSKPGGEVGERLAQLVSDGLGEQGLRRGGSMRASVRGTGDTLRVVAIVLRGPGTTLRWTEASGWHGAGDRR